MKSIRKKLVGTLSYTITGLVLCILLATDIAVDSWIDHQFNRSMHAKAGMLMTLVKQDKNGIEFRFSGEFLPEFEGSVEPEYFQLWYKSAVFERSDSLDLFSRKNLPYENINLGQSKISKTLLPDGRDGRIAYAKFIPQVDTRDRDYFKENSQEPMVLAYAASAEELNFVLWLIDIIFIVTTIAVVVFIRLFVRKSVDTGLSPLNKLNQDLCSLSIADKAAVITLDEPVQELTPMVDSLNRFIEENRQLFLREKRLTSDIAHELKTPIAELINMTEVVLRFPEKNELEADFKPEVLRISKRLKNIVSSLLQLQSYSGQKLRKEDVCDINYVLERILDNSESDRVNYQPKESLPFVVSNLFALESILINLINNAIQHSPESSEILINTRSTTKNNVVISIQNTMLQPLCNENLQQMYEPLWQKDTARTSCENFGLGLSISRALAIAIDAQLTATAEKEKIEFSLFVN
ncbi:sensor histidine kinase [Planctobacterium marinum]|uniref:sensor histidine kinase n=1 Tax=Planctobacterium marinum TaxID=1631968 RepID=UPI001E55BEA9|nr:HAMP domain-containing sensor histidine kinase [Planctobacterium marinum]MCC2604664.1 HAMP domain-containing histidine kinase [Planctobacterium marinum]